MTTATVAYEARPLKRHRRSKAELARLDNAIVEAVAQDYPVTLRGVYYRVVSIGAVEKTDAGYQAVGRQLLKLRRDQVIPYSWITDGTRWITKPTTWTDLDQMLEDASSSYRRALWHRQPYEVQIFTEKDAISGTILPVTSRWDVPLGVLRGYSSESFAYSVARDIDATFTKRGKRGVYVYQLGDHDPSGVDAWRSFTERVEDFLDEFGGFSDYVSFERLAVTADQIVEWSLPTRPTKAEDTRSKKFAGESVDVDAIPAPQLRQLVESAITRHIDTSQLAAERLAERSERDLLLAMRGAA